MTARPPRLLWFAVGLVAVLRALPYLFAVRDPGTAAGVLPPLGYNPKDWLSYVAFIREAAVSGHLFLQANPYTTLAQDGRYLLLFQDALGFVCRWTGADPFVVVELSRVPLLALMLLAYWRVTGVVLADRRERVLACWLLLLSGGLEVLADLAGDSIPAQIAATVQQDLWHLQGWNTFAASYNPLWVAGLALTFATLVPVLRVHGSEGWRDALTLLVGVPLLSWTHPYSAIVVVAVVVLRPLLGGALGADRPWAGASTAAVGLVPALVVLALVSRWQRVDEVYRLTSNYVFGTQQLPVFWYPLTLAAVGVFAVRGWRRWATAGATGRLGVAAWTVAVVLLHSSPVLGGYHFVFHLHAPLCLPAAAGLLPVLDGLRGRRFGRTAIAGILILLFQTPLTLTWKCVREIETHRVRRSTMRAVEALAALPPGNVLSTSDVGLYVPAYTGDRVYVGHWFLTPVEPARASEAQAAVNGLRTADAVRRLIDAEHIRYVVTPVGAAPILGTILTGRAERTIAAGQLTIFVLDGGDAVPAR